MIVLAIDTSGEYLSLALQVNEVRFSSIDRVLNKQSHYIIEKINSLVTIAGIGLKEINLIAYIEGPGSFTGLRIGLSVALGISYGINAKLVAIPNFALYARATNIESDILVGIDARLNQIYLAGINASTLDYFIHPVVTDPDKISIERDVVLVGNGFSNYHKLLPLQLQDAKYIELSHPNPLYMLDIVKLDKYPIIPPHLANLIYLRNKVALNLTEQQQQ